MAKYEKYAEYKDSGVEWLGEIPSHWDLYSLKRSVDKCTNGFWGGEPDGRNDLCVLRVADFNRDNFTINEDKLTLRSVLPKEAESRLLKKGDLLIEKSGGGEKTLVGCVVQFDKDFPAITSNFVAKMSPNVITDSKYLTYAFAHLYSGRVNFPSIKQTTGIQNLDSEAYLMEKFGFPSKNEQIQIANFLDHETTKIDHLIEKQQQLIELLKEKRQAVISHAVTKGLDPNVPMKDSGVEWLGEVPEHWDVIAISKVTQKITNGYVGPTRDILVEEGIPYVQATHIKKGKVNFDNAYFVREKWSNDHAKSILKKDDVLIVQTGAGTGDVGLVSESEEGFNCHALIILQPKKQQLSGSYLAYCLQSDYGYATLYSIRTGGMHPHLNCGEVQFVKISVPPLDEQVAISKFIEKNIQDFDQLIEKAKLAIQLMQERRTALISAAVTGKIDVRHWQAPTVAEAHTELSA